MKARSFRIFLLLILFAGCNLFYPKAHFHLINFSADKPSTDITVKFAGQIIYSGSLNWSNVAPDIRYMFSKSASKGKYNIIIEADSGRIRETHPVSLGKDKWIIIGFTYVKALDSATLIKKFGFVEPERLNGTPPKISVDVRNEPPKRYY